MFIEFLMMAGVVVAAFVAVVLGALLLVMLKTSNAPSSTQLVPLVTNTKLPSLVLEPEEMNDADLLVPGAPIKAPAPRTSNSPVTPTRSISSFNPKVMAPTKLALEEDLLLAMLPELQSRRSAGSSCDGESPRSIPGSTDLSMSPKDQAKKSRKQRKSGGARGEKSNKAASEKKTIWTPEKKAKEAAMQRSWHKGKDVMAMEAKIDPGRKSPNPKIQQKIKTISEQPWSEIKAPTRVAQPWSSHKPSPSPEAPVHSWARASLCHDQSRLSHHPSVVAPTWHVAKSPTPGQKGFARQCVRAGANPDAQASIVQSRPAFVA